MKKNLIAGALLCFTFYNGVAQNLTAADYDKASKFLGANTNKLIDRATVSPNWTDDGKMWYWVSTNGVREYVLINPANGDRKTAADIKSLLPDAKAEKGRMGRRGGGTEITSPDGKKAAFIKDWNLWVKDLDTKAETQLTTDGVENYGYATDNAGWTHSDRAILLWSPDSKKIATFQQDQRHVNDMYLVTTNVGAPKLQAWKYPLPDDKDIIRIERVIIEVDKPKVIRLKMPSDPRRGTLCDDISCSGSFDDNEWNATATKLAFVSSSRDHKVAQMRIADATTGDVKDVFVEQVATQYESGQGSINWRYLEASNEFIWYSERDNWGHLYLYDATTGALKSQISKGDFVITRLLKVDAKSRVLYFEANGREKGRDPYFSHFYSIGFDGKNLKLLTPEDGNHNISLSADGKYFVDNYSQPNIPTISGLLKVDAKSRVLYFEANGREKGRDPYFSHFYSIGFDGKNLKLLTPEDGNHSISLSPDGKYFVDNYSQPNIPTISVLRDMGGKLISNLEKADISRLTATGWKPPTPITVKSRDSKWDLYGLMFTPTNLDPSKKYPVVNYIYPGPQGGGVGGRSFSAARSDHQALAELGFIVVVIDGTCNPDRSKSFHDICYGNMGDNTLEDQISGLKQLAAKFPYMDLDKVGVWGHSGGGYATAAAMFRYPDFYKVGISESGNHENRNYEDDWGERYIGLVKPGAHGVSNYEGQANQNLVAGLKGKLMLAHGAMDDNVPPYNTYLVVDALIKANKDFDLVIFPHARHGFGSDSYYMMRKRWDYFVKNLKGVESPSEYKIQTN